MCNSLAIYRAIQESLIRISLHARCGNKQMAHTQLFHFIRYAEVFVLLLFLLLALLWLFREPKFIDGWGSFFKTDGESGQRYYNNMLSPVTIEQCDSDVLFTLLFSYFSDASTALFIVFLLFVIPSKPCFSLGKSSTI